MSCTENCKESVKMVLELISKFRKAAEYKVCIKKSAIFYILITVHCKLEFKICIYSSNKKHKILRINFLKYMQVLYMSN